MSFRALTKTIFKKLKSREGVALMMVLSALATLAVFVAEITYTSQISQKLAYDRLDLIKAHSLAKSGLRIALLRIRAYTELKKTIASATGNNAAAKSAANSMVPKAILEKIWSEPVTIPFTGDLSSLPLGIRDSLTKFRKESGMEGKLYIAIEAQSSKFNLNSLLPAVAANPTATPKPTATPAVVAGQPTPVPTPTPEPADPNEGQYTAETARAAFLEHIKLIFAKKFEENEKFKDQYRNFKVEDLVQEMIAWADLSYDSIRGERAVVPMKQAPYYDISELHYLTSMDDEIYDLIAPQFNAGMSQGINVNTIKEAVLKGLIPQMTEEERKDFFEYRDVAPPEDHTFKSADDFFKYLSEKTEFFKGVKSNLDELKKALSQRGILIITEEVHFKVKIEATVNQTKRTLEALVTVIEPPSTTGTNPNGTSPTPTPTPVPGTVRPTNNGTPTPERSSLKITQIRFL